MKKCLLAILLFIGCINVSALGNNFRFDVSNFSSKTKNNSVSADFKSDYSLHASLSAEESKSDEEIKQLTKKTTYLLFGEANRKEETPDVYYKRKKDFYALRYNPTIPKDSSNPLGYDTNSQEYRDDLISGIVIPQIFKKATEMDLVFNTYGDIRITKTDDFLISSIVLPKVKAKAQNETDPMKYDYTESDFVMYYYYKKLNKEWKLYYLYGESTDDLEKYIDTVSDSTSGTMSMAPAYEGELSEVYDFSKVNALSDEILNGIYNSNSSSIVFLNTYYNNMVVASANGFFIKDGLVVTTWNYLEKSLREGQKIIINNDQKAFELEGIITAKPELDIAVLKVKGTGSVKIGDYSGLKINDPAITLSSKSGVGLVLQKGVIVSNGDYIQTAIPLSTSSEGSPLFNENGEVVGMNTAKSTNASISMAINSTVLKEISENFSSVDDMEAITFDDLKEKYYYVEYSNDKVYNNISKSKWNKYSKIGNIKDTINLKLVKASYKGGVVSLKYKNDIPKYISSMQLATSFREQLVKDGYKETLNSLEKVIYENGKYQIIIMDEVDYLVIVMVKL